MRGTHSELGALQRGVLHALEMAEEDAERWTAGLDDGAMEERIAGLPSVGFQLRHIARSLDRLLTYAEGRALDEQQLAALATEQEGCTREVTLREFREGIASALGRVLAFRADELETLRGIGRKQLPTTIGGLLVHCAEHTQRHAGQMVTTSKVVRWGVGSSA